MVRLGACFHSRPKGVAKGKPHRAKLCRGATPSYMPAPERSAGSSYTPSVRLEMSTEVWRDEGEEVPGLQSAAQMVRWEI